MIRPDPPGDCWADRLALVFLNERDDAAVRRLMSAEATSSRDTLRWLRYRNAQEYGVSGSMSGAPTARAPEAAIAAIRRLYLDFDESGRAEIQRSCSREDLPEPSFVLGEEEACD